ncbi:MAG TPA: hypothetical protein VMD91_10410 [Candidatus Sulfotelmatobacter sp.]|nr:hypothetical protein [Candidatus Sulfotelmatobacter sp.]
MFTPREIDVGDRVTIVRPLSNKDGTFAAGHAFAVIDRRAHRDVWVFDLRDDDLNLLLDVPASDLAWAPAPD